MDFEVIDDLSEIETDDSFSITTEEEDDSTVLLSCNYCGSCTDPDTCVFGIVCPECNSPVKELCREPVSNKLVGLHEQRWRTAKGREYAWR